MSKFALPALVLCILGLFTYSVTSQPNDGSPEAAVSTAEVPQRAAEVEKAEPKPAQPPPDATDSVRAELKRLSDESKANGDKIAQTATLRAELLKQIQDAKSASDKSAQAALDQINASRADILSDAKATSDKSVQALQQEVAASQARLSTQVGDIVKTNNARYEALAQRVDAAKKDFDELKKSVDEDRQNTSTISPAVALFVALAALVLGPFLAYQFTANQIAGLRQQRSGAEEQPRPTEVAAAEPPPASTTMTEPQDEGLLHHDAPPLGQHEPHAQHEEPHAQRDAGHEASEEQQTSSAPEKA